MEHSKYLIRPVEAYIVMLHLVSNKSAQSTDIQTLCFWDKWRRYEFKHIMGHINHRLLLLSEEWDEDIPRINAFVFYKDGTPTEYVHQYIFELPESEQPTAREVAEYAKAIHTYPKWDKVLEVFRKDALEPKSS